MPPWNSYRNHYCPERPSRKLFSPIEGRELEVTNPAYYSTGQTILVFPVKGKVLLLVPTATSTSTPLPAPIRR